MTQAVINSLKFDGSIKRSWRCQLVSTDGSELVFSGVFDQEVEHSELGLIRQGTLSLEYYWLDRWYNVFEFREPDGSLRNFYCNINMPPHFDGITLEYVDLEVDILVWPGGQVKILDLDEFEISAATASYSQELRDNVVRAMDEVMGMIARRKAPFDRL